VIGFVIIGNPFPVIEHPSTKKYLGKSINPGYQSHFTLGILFIFFNSTIKLKYQNKKLMVKILIQPFQSPKLNN